MHVCRSEGIRRDQHDMNLHALAREKEYGKSWQGATMGAGAAQLAQTVFRVLRRPWDKASGHKSADDRAARADATRYTLGPFKIHRYPP